MLEKRVRIRITNHKQGIEKGERTLEVGSPEAPAQYPHFIKK